MMELVSHEQCIQEVEHTAFTPLVLSATEIITSFYM